MVFGVGELVSGVGLGVAKSEQSSSHGAQGVDDDEVSQGQSEKDAEVEEESGQSQPNKLHQSAVDVEGSGVVFQSVELEEQSPQ